MRVGPFELQQRVGLRAGFETWEAVRADDTLREPREVWVLRVEDPDDEDAVRALQRRYEALKEVDDPRVPKVIGFYAGAGALAIQKRRGVTLTRLAPYLRDDPGLVVDLGLELAQVLRQAHRAGVNHGELHGDLVLVDRRGRITLLGLGARMDMGVFPPERRVSALGDQWLLARLILETTGGQMWRLDGRAPALARVLRRALARAPGDRYLSDRVWLEALHQVARETPNKGTLAEAVAEVPALTTPEATPAVASSSPSRPAPKAASAPHSPEAMAPPPPPSEPSSEPEAPIPPSPEDAPSEAPPPASPASKAPSKLEWIALAALGLLTVVAILVVVTRF